MGRGTRYCVGTHVVKTPRRGAELARVCTSHQSVARLHLPPATVTTVVLGCSNGELWRAVGRARRFLEEVWTIPELALGIVPKAIHKGRHVVGVSTHR